MKSKNSFKIKYKKLGKEQVWARTFCYDNIIEIDERSKGKKLLELIIHESFHILFPELNEEQIIEKSIILTNTLWNEDFRHIDNNNKIKLQDNKKHN